jgi:hypothetical protein
MSKHNYFAVDFLDPRGQRLAAVIEAESEDHARSLMRRFGFHPIRVRPETGDAEVSPLEAFADADSPLIGSGEELDKRQSKDLRDLLARDLRAGEGSAASSLRETAQRIVTNHPGSEDALPAWLRDELRAILAESDDTQLAAILDQTDATVRGLAERAIASDMDALADLCPETFCFGEMDIDSRTRRVELVRTDELGFVIAVEARNGLAGIVIRVGPTEELFDARHEGFFSKVLIIERTDGEIIRIKYDRTNSVFPVDHIAKLIRDMIRETEGAEHS